jgi:hypothetical protein
MYNWHSSRLLIHFIVILFTATLFMSFPLLWIEYGSWGKIVF